MNVWYSRVLPFVQIDMATNKFTLFCNMLRFLFSFLFAFLLIISNAQKTNLGGIVMGNVIHAQNQKPIENATIKLTKLQDSLFFYTSITDKNGLFEIDKISFGWYTLTIKAIGFSSLTIDSLNIRAERFDFNLGDIKLQESSQNLNEVIVYAEKPLIENKDGKIIYNVGESALSSGSTTSELLKSMPLVSNDPNGKILLKGKEPKILIDDKPVELNSDQLKDLLESLPGSSIEKIELMTNPPPEYATEEGGVINIVTKKGKIGSTGKITLSGGTRGEGGLTGNYGYRNKGFSYNVIAGANYSQLVGNSYSKRENFFTDSSNYFNTDGNFKNINTRPNARVQVNYDLKKNQTINFTYQGNLNNFTNQSFNQFTNINAQKLAYKSSTRNNVSDGLGYNHNINFSYTKKGKNAAEVFRLIVGGNVGKNDNDRDFYQQYLTGNFNPTGVDSFQNQLYDSYNKSAFLRLSYDKPIKLLKAIISTGITINTGEDHNQLNTNYLNKTINQYVLSDLLSNNFKFRQDILTARFGATIPLNKKLKLIASVQAEQTINSFNFIKGNASNVSNNYWNVLPNVTLRQDFSKSFNLNMVYRAALRRPNIGEMNPNIDFSDPYNIRFGNPNLSPSKSHNFDINASLTKGKFYMNYNVGYNIVNDVINRIRTLTPDYKTQVSFVNIATRQEYEAGIWGGYTFSKKFRLNTSINYSRNLYSEIEKKLYRYQDGNNIATAINFGYTPNSVFTIDGNIRYAQFADPQGRSRSNLSMNIGLQHRFFDKRLQVSLNIIDPIITQQFTTITTASNFRVESFNNSNTRNFRLAISWQLNKLVTKSNLSAKQKQAVLDKLKSQKK